MQFIAYCSLNKGTGSKALFRTQETVPEALLTADPSVRFSTAWVAPIRRTNLTDAPDALFKPHSSPHT